MNDPAQDAVVKAFRERYRDSGVWMFTTWLGTQVLKNPLDLWIYQEILHRTRPDVIVETGTYKGGSALYLASICDLLDHGRVVTVDVEAYPQCPAHPRITYLTGSSVDEPIVSRIRAEVGSGTAMAILDSDHSKEHVLGELRAYAPMVSDGCYLVVEDTGEGEWVEGVDAASAVRDFLAEAEGFDVDRVCEKFMLTNNPGGFLRRAS